MADPLLHAEFEEQAQNPPGNDPVLGAFYHTLTMMTTEHPVGRLIDSVTVQRADITRKHLANLTFRAFQALKQQNADPSYLAAVDTQAWRDQLATLAADELQMEKFRRMLLTKSTNSTIYQRYAGPHAIMSALFSNRPITVADIGCGGNYGLRGIEVGEPFKPFEDHTPYQSVQENVPPASTINIQRGIAIDREDPDDPDVTAWRFACSFYPKESHQMPELVEFEKRIRASQKVKFHKINLLAHEAVPFQSSDVVILSTILYQFTPEDQKRLLFKARAMAKNDGVLIVQDFARVSADNSTTLDFDNSWGQLDSYRTFLYRIQEPKRGFQEVLIWDGGRCKSVKPGSDFKETFK